MSRTRFLALAALLAVIPTNATAAELMVFTANQEWLSRIYVMDAAAHVIDYAGMAGFDEDVLGCAWDGPYLWTLYVFDHDGQVVQQWNEPAFSGWAAAMVPDPGRRRSRPITAPPFPPASCGAVIPIPSIPPRRSAFISGARDWCVSSSTTLPGGWCGR